MPRRKLSVLAIAAVAFAAGALPTSAAAARPLTLGIVDDAHKDSDPAIRAQWLDNTVAARAEIALIGVRWANVVPGSPLPGFNPADPADPGYTWTTTDAAVRDATARGLRVMLHISGAPAFAEGPNRPSQTVAPAGSWLPDPGQVAAFGRAIASRYSGRFGGLPRVALWQLWAEPNLSLNLAPQTVGKRLVSADHYRAMLNAFYGAVKGVSPDNLIITAGTSPYGDLVPVGGPVFQRTQPLRFWQDLLCFKERKSKGKGRRPGRRAIELKGVACPDPAHFDVASHHPINVGRPRRPAMNRRDISTPDMGKLTRVLRKAWRSGRSLPTGPKPLWATEIWWNSNPPHPDGIRPSTHARWLAESLYLLWRQGVSTVIWFQVRDYADAARGLPIPRSGLFFRGGEPKPAFTAFRFPFVVDEGDGKGKRGKGRSNFRVWGKAPAAGQVQIQRGKGSRWKTIRKLTAERNRIFLGKVWASRGSWLRAKTDLETSLPWRIR